MTDTDTDPDPDLADLDDDAQAKLTELEQIAEHLADLDEVYARRSRLVYQLRERVPPVKFRVIARYARSSEEAVIQAHRKAKKELGE